MATTTGPATTSADETKVWILRVAKVVVWIIYLFVLTALVILLIAFFLRLFGANTGNSFTDWIYRSADRIMEPFRGIFPTKELGTKSVLDYSLLFAVIMYTIFALVAHWVVHVVSRKLSGMTAPPPPQPIQQYIVATPMPPTTNVNVGSGPPTTVAAYPSPTPPSPRRGADRPGPAGPAVVPALGSAAFAVAQAGQLVPHGLQLAVVQDPGLADLPRAPVEGAQPLEEHRPAVGLGQGLAAGERTVVLEQRRRPTFQRDGEVGGQLRRAERSRTGRPGPGRRAARSGSGRPAALRRSSPVPSRTASGCARRRWRRSARRW